MNKISGIYQIQSKIHPERIYIGSAVNIYNRWSVHLSDLNKNKHHSNKLQHHYNKYGKDDLTFSVLIECEKHQLIQFEQYYLDFYHPCFNGCQIAGSILGIKRSKETIKKLSDQKIGNKNGIGNKGGTGKIPWNKDKKGLQIAWNKGKKATLEAIQHQRESHMGLVYSEAHCKNISVALINKPKSEIHKQHLRDAWVKRKLSKVV